MSEPTPTIKHKTKAKTRYLKGKKERRKQRKSLANASKPKATKKKYENSSDSSDGSDEEVLVETHELAMVAAPEEQDIEMLESGEQQQLEEEKPKKEKRPKKKRKKDVIAEEQDDIVVAPAEAADIANEQLEEPEGADKIKESVRADSPATIPSFPMPIQPPQASKKQLALQGMDIAMLEAEIVDPGMTEDLSRKDGVVARLSERMLKRLGELGISELFAVQTILIPFLLPKESEQRALYQPYNPPRDVCASAPTGSGKTLAYVIPIVEILSTRIVTRLRALVILPTRDLVQQVRETFEAFCKGTKLQIATATGQHSFAHEQAQLVGSTSDRLMGGSSKVDILICTPGRLIDHINGTPNFTLQHLRFLVVDEADRLLTQSFQEWLKQVLTAIRPPVDGSLGYPREMAQSPPNISSYYFPQPDALAPAWISPSINGIRTDIDEPTHSSCQKLLFSATLTRDPAKIASLELRDPRYIIVRGKNVEDTDAMDVDERDYMETFETPATLKEWMLVCESSAKPLHLFLLTHHYDTKNALVFTKSADSTSRLLHLLGYFEEAWAGGGEGRKKLTAEAFSSDLSPVQRRNVLERFKQKQIDILICSDLISRGMDIPHVSHVINYDVPIGIRKYIHRVGRTARAGREGDAWSLIEEQEVHHFKVMMKQSNHWSKLKKLKADKAKVDELEKYYQVALQRLKGHYSQGALN